MLKSGESTESLYRQLPQIGRWLESAAAAGLLREWPRELVTEASRNVIAALREQVRLGAHTHESLESALDRLQDLVAAELDRITRPSLCRVINATGVILQTNLGRAPLSEAAIERIAEVARGYCNLELDLDTGERGRRDDHAEGWILRLLESRAGMVQDRRAAMAVNNCAAAVFLALNTLAEGGEVIVSRGELVEIGGGFRIPDILRKSGATLREVGTTNRTRMADYASAIGPQTRLILRVHRSNFRIDGFTEQPSLEELVSLGSDSGIPVMEDQGTGCMVRLEEFGIRNESSWVRSITSGAALVTASGDKLLGGPQCGILAGERELVARIRANPLARALRVDKLTYAALQSTLLAYLAGREESIPAIAMMRLSPGEIRQRCETLAEYLRRAGFVCEVVATQSVIGGGTTPGATLPSFAIALEHAGMSEGEVASALRRTEPPVIARTQQGRVLLDLRTVQPEDDARLTALLSSLGNSR